MLDFSKANAKFANYFRNYQIFQEESFIFILNLTVLNISRRFMSNCSLLIYIRTLADMCGHTHTCAILNNVLKIKEEGRRKKRENKGGKRE